MSGKASPRETKWGLFTRLQTPLDRQRDGSFCVYVADRFVLAALTQEEITAISEGCLQMDLIVRRYIHDNLSYRFVATDDVAAAFKLESQIESGEWGHGKPLLSRFR
jgi:hypothetical protein